MEGAVGLWLWSKPSELRSGSVTVWEHPDDVWRFVRWSAHAEIVRAWRERTSPSSDHWRAEHFDAEQVWARAEAMIEKPHPGAR